MSRVLFGALIAALLASGCSLFRPRPDACVPVDTGGECVAAIHQGFIDHALASTRAWPQLDGLQIEATEVMSLEESYSRTGPRPPWRMPGTDVHVHGPSSEVQIKPASPIPMDAGLVRRVVSARQDLEPRRCPRAVLPSVIPASATSAVPYADRLLVPVP